MTASAERTYAYDVVVIGAGLAGLVAAARAAAAGARVGVVSIGHGNLGLWSGLVSGAGGTAGEALRFFLDSSEAADLPYRRGTGGGFRLLSPSGRTTRAFLAPATMAPGDLGSASLGRQAKAAGLLIVGFTEFGDYPSALIAGRAREETDLEVEHRSLSLGPAAGRGYAPRLASLFDDPAWFGGFLESCRRVLAGDKAVGFPPVLGLERGEENRVALEAALGRPVFELPGLPPSIPGQRFARRWRHALERGGRVRFHLGRKVTGTCVENGRCLWVTDGSARWRAAAFVLATGGVAGGGLDVPPGALLEQPEGKDTAGAAPREPLFGLETSGAGTDWLAWGVRAGRDLRPYPGAGGAGTASAAAGRKRAYANLFVAGWQLGTAGARRPGGGVPGPDAWQGIETGFRAGERAAALALGKEGRPDGLA